MARSKIGIAWFGALVASAGAFAALGAEPGLAPGDQRKWELHFHVRLEQPGGQKPGEAGVSGEWLSTIAAVRQGEYDAALELANARLARSAGNASVEVIEEAQRRLGRRFWATYREDGSLVAAHFYKDVNPNDRNLLLMIATETQFVRSSPARPAWEVFERDSAGRYLAAYQQPQPGIVIKRKVKYVDTDGVPHVPADTIQIHIDQSETRYSLDPSGEITRLDGTDRMRIGAPFANAGQLTAIAETHLANLRKSRAPELAGSLKRALPGLQVSPVATQALDPVQALAQQDDRLIEGRTTDSLLQAATIKGKPDDSFLPERLTALFRRRPEAIAAALEILRTKGSQTRITAALGSAGSRAAIEALEALIDDSRLPLSVRVDALTAFALVQHPSTEAMHAPSAFLDDDDRQIRSAARMVSGALARAGRAQHPAEADQLDEELLVRYQKATDPGELVDLLASFGNSVGPSVLPAIRESLHDSRVLVRAAAARALRLASGSEIDRLLSTVITGDSEPAVRDAAIFAAGFRHPLASSIAEALVNAARSDAADSVRTGAVNLLRRNPDASRHTAETLEWVAENDAKPAIRRLARESLARISAEKAGGRPE